MRKFKKQISAVTLLFFLCCFILPAIPAEAAPYTDLTDAQIEAVVSWAYDKAYGSPYSNYQCLAYVYQAYHNAIGVNIGPGGSFGSAIEASRNLPLHYDAPANVPKGAIVFWEAAPSNGYYGHAGISVGNGRVISANVTWSKYPDQRVFDHAIEGFLIYDNSGRKLQYIGWAWPYGHELPVVTIENTGITGVTESNANLTARVQNAFQQVTEVGCYLGTDGVNWPYKAMDTVDITDKYTNVWYDNAARDFGTSLQPGTTYYYKFYAIVNGNYVEGPIDFFKTAGTKPTDQTVEIQNNSVTNITEANAKLSAKVLNNKKRVTKVGCYLGESKDDLCYHASDAVSISDVYTNVWYDDMARDFGIALKPGTKYYYQFYAVVDGKTYQGSIDSFSTTKEEKKAEVVFSNIAASGITPTNAYLSADIVNKGAGIISEVGCSLGMDQNANTWTTRETSKTTGNINVNYNLRQNFQKATILPGKTYYYKFYAVVDGRKQYSETKQFMLLSTEDALKNYFSGLYKLAKNNVVDEVREGILFKGMSGAGVDPGDLSKAKGILGNIDKVQIVYQTLAYSSECFIALGDAIGKSWVAEVDGVETILGSARKLESLSVEGLAQAYLWGLEDKENQTTTHLTKVKAFEKELKNNNCTSMIKLLDQTSGKWCMMFHPEIKKELNTYKKKVENIKMNYDLEVFYNLGRYGAGD